MCLMEWKRTYNFANFVLFYYLRFFFNLLSDHKKRYILRTGNFKNEDRKDKHTQLI